MSEHAINARRRRALATLASIGGALLPLQLSWAQDAKSTLRLLVGYPAGGGGDALVRRISKSLGAVVPQAVVVDNKPGAGGTVAASALATSPPDGSVVYMADSAILVAPAVYEKLGYDPRTLTPVLGVGQLGYCMVVHPSFPARSVAEFIQVLKAAPGKYSYASPGIGNIAHLAAEAFKRDAGVDMVHVPYKGGGPALSDLIGGQIPICFISLPPALAQAQAGKLRMLAVTTAKRWPTAPEVPTLAETLPGFEAVTNSFIVAPPKTPAAIVERLAAAFRKVYEDPELRQAFLGMGATVELVAADALAQQIAAELKRWPELARSIGIRPGAT
jgi:tripartite-type tricarboxylate transporter receptor subunit TctC